MISVILNWVYIGITTWICGFACLTCYTHFFPYKIKRPAAVILAGLVFVTVYAQFFSLIMGVGLLCNTILCGICLILAFATRKRMWAFLCETIFKKGKTATGKRVAVFVLFLLAAYGTSRGYQHFDTGLYHAQSIRWIEEYGVVPGLAALQARFAYNSAAFPLTALYSMKFMTGQSLHTTAGFFAFISSTFLVDGIHIFSDKRISSSDLVRLGLLFYLGVIYSQMVSPASDYYAQLLLFDAVILWLSLQEEGEKQAQPYALLCLLLVYAVTIKVSTGLMLLLVLIPLIKLIRDKEYRQIIVCVLAGICVLLPYLIRNVMISGWLLYPSVLIDLFSPDWKIPRGQVAYDAMEIGVYGKNINDVTKWNTPFCDWIGGWFQALKLLEKGLVILTLLSAIVGILCCAFILIKGIKEKAGDAGLFLAVLASAMFWFLSAPLVRYGYAYLIILPCLCTGFFLQEYKEKQSEHRRVFICVQVLVVLFILTRVKGFLYDIRSTWQQPYYVWQKDYATEEAVTKEVSGITFYVPVNNGQIGYDKFPSSLFVHEIELRGDTIKEGFRQAGGTK